MGQSSQITGLDLGCVIHTRGHTVGQQFKQFGARTGGIAGADLLEQFHQLGDLNGRQRQRRNPERGAFRDMGAIG